MSKLVMGYWDCPICGNKEIRGDITNCPSCGRARGDVQCYVKGYQGEALRKEEMNQFEQLNDQKAQEMGSNPDWYCSFCNSLNSDNAQTCGNCGATRADSEANYFDRLKKRQEAEAAELAAQGRAPAAKPKSRLLLIIAVIVAAIVGIVVWMNSNKTAGDLKVTALNWTRVIQIEANKQYSESDWSMPQGAELVETKQEISGYREVFDHYENVQVQRSRQVYDHDEYTLKDNGNGTFTQVAHPVYRTEYYTETEKRAVTRPEPIYNTKYYYTIWRWKPEREVTASGTDHNTAWPEYTLADNEREGNRTEDYRFTVEHTQKQSVPETYRLAESDWEKINVGDQIFITAKRSGANPFISDEKGNKLMDIQKVN